MRPHDADQIIESIGLGGHDWAPDDVRDAYEMDALATIAGMREEWAREARITGGTAWHNLGWCRSRAEAELTDWSYFLPRGATVEYRLARRYVTEQEVIA